MAGMLIETEAELGALLADLRRVGGDHQWIEVKKAAGGLPSNLWKSLSALANSGGGLLLLGVDEGGGAFEVTGLADPAATSAAVQSLCSTAEPHLRAQISHVIHGDCVVVVCAIPALERRDQPCHFPAKGDVHVTSFKRVHDGDETMTRREVNALLEAREPTDHSARPAPANAELDDRKVTSFLGAFDGTEAHDRLAQFRVKDGGRLTLAGWLVLGNQPQSLSPLGRVACLSPPRPSDPPGAEQRATHVEGTIGELLDGTIQWLSALLEPVQVRRDGRLVDELDYPIDALRELLSNALVHRSFTFSDEATTISVRGSEVVAITSPGGAHLGVDVTKLGLGPMSTPRNYALVRLCEKVQTPGGGRIVESQATGIARADRLCRESWCLPPLFVVSPDSFTAITVRGSLDVARVADRWPQLADLDQQRLVAGLWRLHDLREADPSSALSAVQADVYLACRILGKNVPEHVAAILADLTTAGMLQEHRGYDRLTWSIVDPDRSEPAGKAPGRESGAVPKAARVSRRERTQTLLRILEGADDLGLRPSEIDLGVGIRSVQTIVRSAIDNGLIEPTDGAPQNPQRRYRLTASGRQALADSIPTKPAGARTP